MMGVRGKAARRLGGRRLVWALATVNVCALVAGCLPRDRVPTIAFVNVGTKPLRVRYGLGSNGPAERFTIDAGAAAYGFFWLDRSAELDVSAEAGKTIGIPLAPLNASHYRDGYYLYSIDESGKVYPLER